MKPNSQSTNSQSINRSIDTMDLQIDQSISGQVKSSQDKPKQIGKKQLKVIGQQENNQASNKTSDRQ